MSAINLIPADRLERRATQVRIRVWTIRVAAVAAIGVTALVAGLRGVSVREREATALESEFLQLQDRVALAERVLDARDQLLERRRSITAIQVRHPIANTLDTFGRALPSRASLTYLQLIHRDPGDDDPPPGVVLRGHAPDHAEVGTLLRGLETAGRFDDIQLVRMTERGDGKRSEIEFEVSARLSTGEAG